MNMEILEEFSGSNDHMIVKRKRTKRLRPSSSTSSSGGGGGGGGHGVGEFSYNSSPMSTSSGISTSTEEDEDMANCLILLARGGFSEEEIKPPEKNFSSRKFAEMATTTIGKVGIYLYECKTCSRTFPSFQALGGHRASHKKPKTAMDADQKKSPTAAPPPPDEEERKFTKFNPSISTQLPNYVENKPKIHECSICGSEFASGQALGGHMRRHRSAIGTTTRSGDGCTSLDVSEKTRNVLELDLNLPAPPEDDRCETEFHQFSSNQQPRLVFSAAALVDCHY